MRLAQQEQRARDESSKTTHFGFETIAEGLKQSKGMSTVLKYSRQEKLMETIVASVFSSVASSYDTMNDLMSLGIHRLWKDDFVRGLNPGINPLISSSTEPHGLNILDIAGGTGDIAFRMLDHATKIHNDTTTKVTVADINPDMLAEGRKRANASEYRGKGRLDFIEANAEVLDMIPSNSIDLYTVAFGIRNFTSIPNALREAHRVLKPGGVFACLEFSKVQNPAFNYVYKRWSFGAIPLIGQIVAGDRDSYQYLVESIERFPSQEEFRDLIKEAGLMIPGEGEGEGSSRQGWQNLNDGIACIHKGVKPL
jgi:2-methoxy-6-polyprenyl-1,4-benzoquinol methylase